MKTSGLVTELLKKPNPYMTDYEFRFVMGFNFEMHGEAAAIIKRSRNGLPIELYPVSPSALVSSFDDGVMYYTLAATTGERYSSHDVLLIRNTPTGYGAGAVLDPIYYASDDLDLEDHCRQMQKEFYNGASVIGNMISVPQNFTTEMKDAIRAQFEGRHFRNYVVDERVKITPIQVQSGDIAKLTEAQKWNAQEVARRFNVPPFFIGDTTGTYNNSEQQGMQMVIYCLRPRITAWESALNSSLCRAGEFIKFSLEGLLRGDHATRSAFYHNAIMDGWMSINEVRRLEDLSGIGSDGDVHFFPMNYGSLSDIVAGKYATGNGGSIWDLPAGEERKRPVRSLNLPVQEETPEDKAKRLKEEKRRKDLKFVSEAKAPAQSNRSKLEKLIRTHLKAEIAELKTLIATGQPTGTVLSDFKDWLDQYASEIQPQYKAIYLDILKKMIPVVQKEIGNEDDVSETKADEYASAYADSMSKRQTGAMNAAAQASAGTDHFEADMDTLEADYPITQSEEEVNRSSNAFNVWLFSQLGVTVFHVVASSNACSFCASLDGKTASVEGYVLQKGSDVDDGEGSVRHIDKNYRHPPFHSHCKCSVAPGE